MAKIHRVCLSGVVLGSLLLLIGTGLAQDGMKRLSKGDLRTLTGGGYTYAKGWCDSGTACDSTTMCLLRSAEQCTTYARNLRLAREYWCNIEGHENDDCRLSDTEEVCTDSYDCYLGERNTCHEKDGQITPVKAITVCSSAPCIPH
jgi:hypothetical protein